MKIKRIFATVLSFVLILTMLPAMAFAAGNSDTSTDGGTVSENGLTLTKTATLENNGTYTIDLEAYATGTTTTITEKSGTPLDIVLVIDQSGSMYRDGYLDPMKNAVTSFVNSISDNAEEYNVDHRIAIVGYASDEDDGETSGNYPTNGSDSAWINTGLYVNGEFKNYETPGGYTAIYSSQMDRNETYYIVNGWSYAEITYNTQSQSWGYYDYWGRWQSITPKTSADDRWNTQVYTYTEGGSLTASDYQNALVSVNTTDADGNVAVNSSITTAVNSLAGNGGTRTSYGMEMANQVFANNSIEGTDRQRVVVVFTDGVPGKSGYDGTEANSAVSQAYETKQTYGAKVYTIGLYSEQDDDRVTNFMNYLSSNYPEAKGTSDNWWGDNYHGAQISDPKYYQTTDDASELEDIFTNISQDIQHPSTEVTLDANAVMQDIMGTGFVIPSGYDVSKNVSIQTVKGSTEDNSNYTWGDTTTSPDGISANVSADGNAIEVTGFDYAANYIATGHDGAKLVVQIRGILPTDDAVTNDKVSTNNAESGVYASSTSETAALTFPEPQTILTSKAYVLDYAKETALTGLDQNTSVTAIADTMRAVKAEKDIAVTGTYGNSALSQNSVSYAPKTTNWDGYDNLYVFGKTTNETVKAASANANGNLWSKVSVIPANNVYYEDDFVTDTTSGTVGIVYTGSWDPDGTSANNGETANNAVHGGWVENDTGLSNDATYSDGSAQKGTTGATATFTFTGTGVDVYSRTDMTTGTITANLYTGETASKANISKSLIVDNKSASGTYYQIPTVSFNDLEYGIYTVKITVTNAAASDGNRVTYYLDGIRVYNPIQDQESDEIVNGAYKDELGAVFTSARDLLQSGSVAFIDEDTNGNSAVGDYTSSEVGKLAPKNEIYLSKDQSITLKVDMTLGNTYYLGLKAPADSATTAEITNGSAKSPLTISHSTDLYYKVTPNNDGTIVVTNTGNNLLSITKLRTTGSGTDGLAVIGQDEALNAITAFKTASYVEYAEDTLTEDETTGGETAGEGTVDEDDIVIEKPDDSGSQNEDNQTTEENSGFQSWISNLFNGIKNLFSRW